MPERISTKSQTKAAVLLVSFFFVSHLMAGADDIDDDGIADEEDNCVFVANPPQRDTDGDGVGNYCDPDLNNDWLVSDADRGILNSVFFTMDADADFNGDGNVNFLDLAILQSQLGQAPGPPGTISWAASANGFWNDSSKWQPQIVPSDGVTAIIDVASEITVTLDGDTASVKTLILNEDFDLTDATFSATNQIEASGTITMTGSVINNTTIVPSQAGAGQLQVNAGATNQWNNLTLGIDSVIGNGRLVEVAGGLTLNADVTINAPTSPTGLAFSGSQSVNGSGNIIFNGTGNTVLSEPRLFPSNGSTLTFSAGLTISGGNGTIGQSFAALVLDCDIIADTSSETLIVSGAPWSSTGILGASNGGTLQLSGDLDNGGSALTLDTASGNLKVLAGTGLFNATLNGTPGSHITLNAGSYTFQNLVLNTDLTLNNGAIANVSGGLTVNDSLTINAPTSPTGLHFVETQTLGGSGSVLINGTGNSLISEPRLFPLTGTTLTIGPDLSINGGNGTIGNLSAGLILNADVAADVSAETFVIIGTPWSGNGTLSAISGASIEFAGTLDNTNNALALDAPSGTVTLLNNAGFSNATINATPGTNVIISSGSHVFDALVLNVDLTFNNGAIANVSGGLTVNDSLRINAPTSPTGLHFVETQTLGGSGSVLINGTGNGVISEPRLFPFNFTTLTLGPELTINGGNGTIGQSAAALVLNGTISATTANLQVIGSAVTNNGLLEALAGHDLAVDNLTSNPGTMHAGADSTLILQDPLSLSSGSHVMIDIGGLSAVGRVSASAGSASYDGTATIRAVNGFTPNVNDSFVIFDHMGFSGSFNTVNSLGLAPGESFTIINSTTEGEATVTN